MGWGVGEFGLGGYILLQIDGTRSHIHACMHWFINYYCTIQAENVEMQGRWQSCYRLEFNLPTMVRI